MISKLVAVLAVIGGFISVTGDALIRFAMFIVDGRGLPNAWPHFFLDPRWMALTYLSGFLSVGFLAPLFIKRIRMSTLPGVIWTKHGVLFGALAGIANVIVLASIHLSLMASNGIKSGGLEGVMPVIFFFLTYLPLSVLIMGVPAAAIGVLAGIVAEIFLRKFIFSEGRTLP